jgi:hypothetical protein
MWWHQALDIDLVGIEQQADQRHLIVRLVANVGQDEKALMGRIRRSLNQRGGTQQQGCVKQRLNGHHSVLCYGPRFGSFHSGA